MTTDRNALDGWPPSGAPPEGGPSRSFAPSEGCRESAPPHRLAPADRLHGVAVFDQSGEKIGDIEDVVVDETTGKVAYALMRHGGFMGLGLRCRPVPWSMLGYDARLDGYVILMERRVLDASPTFEARAFRAATDGGYREKVHAYYAAYGAAPHWT